MTAMDVFAQERALASIRKFFTGAEWIDFSLGKDLMNDSRSSGRATVTGHLKNAEGKVLFVKAYLGVFARLGGKFASTPVRMEARWQNHMGDEPTNFTVTWNRDGGADAYPVYTPTTWGDAFLKIA